MTLPDPSNQVKRSDLIKRYRFIVTELQRVHKTLDRFNPKRNDYKDKTDHSLACLEHQTRVLELEEIVCYYEKILLHLNDTQP